MPFHIHYKPGKHYLHVDVDGDMTLSAARTYLDNVETILQETGTNRILIDSRRANMRLSSIDLITVSRMVAESAEAGCKRALVDNQRSGLSLFESISQSRGQSIRAFTDVDEALEWLLSDSD